MLVQAARFATLLDIKHLYIKMVRQRRDRPDISGVHLWLVLGKANHALGRHSSRSVEAAGMCRSDFGVLEALLHKGPLPVTVLGTKVLLTSGSITTAVDRLERRGLVERSGEASDRRTRLVRLTGAGRKLIRKLFVEHEQAMEKAVSALAPTERAALIGLLRKLGRGAEEILPGSPRRESPVINKNN
jgi:MarR family transcriptional regulator, 2-MHQ and catechol-resistance regulon repressor